MSKSKPDKAFILAAGKGTRMRPHTDHMPKPMVEVNGRPILDYTIDKLVEAGVREIVINLHHFGDMIKEHYQGRDDVSLIYSEEAELLDTGGGVKNVIERFGDEPFYVVAGDAFWEEDQGINVFDYLAENWDADKMDILTLMQPVDAMALTKGVGDYDLKPDGHVQRRTDKDGSFMWTNIRLNSPAIYEDASEGAFSFLNIMDECEAQGRFYGLEMPGKWHHISTPEDLENVNQALTGKRGAA